MAYLSIPNIILTIESENHTTKKFSDLFNDEFNVVNFYRFNFKDVELLRELLKKQITEINLDTVGKLFLVLLFISKWGGVYFSKPEFSRSYFGEVRKQSLFRSTDNLAIGSVKNNEYLYTLIVRAHENGYTCDDDVTTHVLSRISTVDIKNNFLNNVRQRNLDMRIRRNRSMGHPKVELAGFVSVIIFIFILIFLLFLLVYLIHKNKHIK